MGHYACDMRPEWFEPDPPARRTAMPRKASVIMTVAEKKSAQVSLRTELADAKDTLKAAQADEKEAAKRVKAATKTLEGLKTRKSTLDAAPTRKADKAAPTQQPLL